MTTHSGTHLDARYFFHATMNGKLGVPERAITIDEVPFEWCFLEEGWRDFRDCPVDTSSALLHW